MPYLSKLLSAPGRAGGSLSTRSSLSRRRSPRRRWTVAALMWCALVPAGVGCGAETASPSTAPSKGPAPESPTPSSAISPAEPLFVAESSTTAAPRQAAAALEEAIFQSTNAERRRHGLSTLRPEAQLANVARRHSQDMARRGYFSHVNPDGLGHGDRVAREHRRLVGNLRENLWSGEGYRTESAAELAEIIVEGWMNSPGHRANILEPSVERLGVGVRRVGGSIMATQLFTNAGYLTNPLPRTVRRGEALLVEATRGDLPGPPVLWDLSPSDSDAEAQEPQPLGPGPVTAAPGHYQLRLWVLQSETDGGKRYQVYSGPLIEVV